ncbi:MAG: CDP-archaeol synthase, partial [Thermoplasmata archaeon]
FGALLGDIVESFFKRRVGKERGEDWIPFDQVDFLIGALILCYIVSAIFQFAGILDYNWFLKNFSPLHLLVIFVITPLLHIISNKLYRGR